VPSNHMLIIGTCTFIGLIAGVGIDVYRLLQ